MSDSLASVSSEQIADNLEQVKARIDAAARGAGRDPAEVTLIAVSKGHDAAAARAALVAGHRVFGENRVQEALAKWPPLRDEFPDAQLHMIGPLQSNKAGDALALFDVIHTIDRGRLAARLRSALGQQTELAARAQRFFVQVNTGEEPQKAGIAPAEADGFIENLREEFGIDPAGLMCIPPVDEEPAPHFALLSKIAQRNGIRSLSMGMSHDFETAVMFGATHVRVGTAIFGARAGAAPH
jgi:pyridoxal phosphate enzyme (YggS family)